MPQIPLSRLFAQRPFVRFWSARLAGMLANQMLMVAVAWQIYDITGSACYSTNSGKLMKVSDTLGRSLSFTYM